MRTIRLFVAGDDAEGSRTSVFISGSEMRLPSRVITRVEPLLEMCHVVDLAAQVGNAL
jgi:hypothetical protein